MCGWITLSCRTAASLGGHSNTNSSCICKVNTGLEKRAPPLLSPPPPSSSSSTHSSSIAFWRVIIESFIRSAAEPGWVGG